MWGRSKARPLIMSTRETNDCELPKYPDARPEMQEAYKEKWAALHAKPVPPKPSEYETLRELINEQGLAIGRIEERLGQQTKNHEALLENYKIMNDSWVQ